MSTPFLTPESGGPELRRALAKIKKDALLGLPNLHAATHSDGATDEVDLTDLAGFPGGTTTFLRADGTFDLPSGGVPGAHASSHGSAGSDPVSIVLAQISDVPTITDIPTPTAIPFSDNFGHLDGGWIEQGSGSGFDADTVDGLEAAAFALVGDPPEPHAASHSDGSSDPIDVTDLDGYPGGVTNFLRADGSFAAPDGGNADTVDGAHASATMTADMIPILDASAELTPEVLSPLSNLTASLTTSQLDNADLFIVNDVSGTSANKKIRADALAESLFNDVGVRVALTTLADGLACSIVGRSANSSGVHADISISEGQFLLRESNVVKSANAVTVWAAKSIPVAADQILVADSAASDAPKKSTISQVFTNAPAGTLPIGAHAAQAAYTFIVNDTSGSAVPTAKAINSFTSKTAPVDGDLIPIADSAASNAIKQVTRGNLLKAPCFFAYKSSGAQAITTGGSGAKVTLDNDSSGGGFDTHGIFASSTLTITAATAGKWLFGASLLIDAMGAGKVVEIKLYKNGAQVAGGGQNAAQGGGTFSSTTLTYMLDLVSTDTVEVYVQHDHGSNRSVQAFVQWTFLHGTRIST